MDGVAVELGVEGGFELTCGAGELDCGAAGVEVVDGEAVGLEPSAEGFEVRVGGAVEAAEVIGLEPVMEVGVAGGVGGSDEVVERGFLLGGAAEDEEEA